MNYVTTSLKLPQEVMKDLKHKAVQEKKSVSQLVKEAVQQLLTAPKESVDYRDGSFNKIIGMAKSGTHDGSVNHDRYLYGKIGTIEKVIMDLKLDILKELAPIGKKTTSFKGILKGVDITDEDIALEKKSLYSKLRA